MSTERLVIAIGCCSLWMAGTLYYYPQLWPRMIQVNERDRLGLSESVIRRGSFLMAFFLWWAMFGLVFTLTVVSLFQKPPPQDPHDDD